MKKIIYSLLSVLFIAITLNSCVDDTDYETPQISCTEPILTGSEVSMETILNQWIAENDTDGDNVVEYNETENPIEFDSDYTNYIVGYVVSNDKTGNFYKELYIQNDPINPTNAIKLAVNIRSLYAKYDVGRKVYVYLHDLALNKDRGEMVIGEMINSQFDDIREYRAKENILRNCEATPVAPVVIETPNLIDDSYLGMLVQFNNMQFDLSLVDLDNPENTKTFVDPYDDYDSHRSITNCDNDSQIKLETSTYASFKDDKLPSQQGSVQGILARDYTNHFYVLRVSSPDDFNFDGERCDPVFLDCSGTNIGGATIVFEENFESYPNYSTNFGGLWENINVNGGSTTYIKKSYSGNGFAECSAYGCGEDPLEVWLISPAINLDSTTDEELTFDTLAHHDGGPTLTVFVSDDYAGDITTATWQQLNAHIGTAPSSTYGSFESSGSIDISCLSGDIVVAFKYKGADGSLTTGMRVDNVKITGN